MGNCPRCYGKKWLKTGKYKDGLRLWRCWRCGTEMQGDKPFERQEKRVLYLDIETSLTDLYGNFGLKVQGEWIGHKMVRKPFFIICWSAMIVGKSKVYSGCVTKDEALARSDKNILAPLWDLMDSADIIAGHNSDQFDIPRITGRFLVNGFGRLEKFRTYDTKKMARKHKFESNSLDSLCRLFGIGTKDKMDIDDWIAIQETGDEKALKKMLKYNRGDVRHGVEIFNILQRWHEWPNDYGARRFAKEPLDTRTEIQTPLREIQDSLDDLVMEQAQ